MYSGDENRQSCKYWKFTAASTQNDDFYCKKWSFALLLLTNPLPLTIRHIIAMGVVAIGGLLSLTIWPQRVMIMVISMIFLDGEFWISKENLPAQHKISKFQRAKSVVFQSTMGNTIFLVAADTVLHFPSFQSSSSIRVHQGIQYRKRIMEKEPNLMEKLLRQS